MTSRQHYPSGTPHGRLGDNPPESGAGAPVIVDLSLPVRHGMDAYPGEPTAEFSPFSTLDDGGIEMWNVRLFSQLGTHVDAPSHFVRGGSTAEQIPLTSCVGPALVVDATRTPYGLIDEADLLPHEAGIRRTGRLLLRTGWSARYGRPEYWTDFPRLTPRAAGLLAAWELLFLGLDTPTPSLEHVHEVHRTLLGAGVVLAECLRGLEGLKGPSTYLVCLPLALVGLDGAPARVIAIEETKECQ